MPYNRMLIFASLTILMLPTAAQAQLTPPVIDAGTIGQAAEIELAELKKDISGHWCLTSDEKRQAEAKLREIEKDIHLDQFHLKEWASAIGHFKEKYQKRMDDNTKAYDYIKDRVVKFPICKREKPLTTKKAPSQSYQAPEPKQYFKPDRSSN